MVGIFRNIPYLMRYQKPMLLNFSQEKRTDADRKEAGYDKEECLAYRQKMPII